MNRMTCLLALLVALPAAGLELTPGAIMLPVDATAAERHAAAELADHFKRIAGTEFPITNAAPSAGTTIVLRRDPALAAEQYRLKASPETRQLILSGGRPRGLLYGVYGLLADHFGCRWFTPEVAQLPRRARLTLPDALDETRAPRFEYREVFWTEAFDGDWAARNRLNSSHARLQPHHGGKISYGPFVHTFDRILPVEQHFGAHPEYYSLINGKRVRERTQLCLSNPEVLAHAIAAVRRWIAEQPEASIFSVSQNDWHNPCACPSCKAVDDAEGSHAGSLITFVNAVADAIAKDHPHVAIDTLAYQYTRKPPRSVRPRPNVIVRLCSIECCFAHPLDGCPEASNTSFVEDLRGWSKLTDRLYIWDYTTDFAHYLLPFPNLGVLDQNLRTFAGNGVAGVFEQGAYSKGGGGELAELRSWVLAQLLWDPQRDGESLTREFVAGVYGPAAPAVQRYLDLRAEALQRAGNDVRIYAGPHRSDLLPADVAAWRAALDEAQALAGDDHALQARIRRLQMSVWYAQVARGQSPAGTLRSAASNLAAAAVAEGLTDFREASRGIQFELAALTMDQQRRERPPAPAGTIVIDDQRFNLHRPGDLTDRVVDPAADDGVAARLVGRTTEWAIMWVHRGDPDVPPGRYRILPRLRVEATGTNGAAFHVGVYDTNSRKSLGERRVQAVDAPATYTNGPVLEADLREGVEIYLAPDDNPDQIRALFLDALRLEPVPAERARFVQATEHGRQSAEAFGRARRYVDGWLAHTDPATGLIPRNLRESRYWNGRDAGADNYAFLVLTAAMTDRPLLEGRLLDMLRTEERVTARIDRLPDDFDFATQAWRRPTVDLDATIFDGAEYVKDGLLYVTEWLGDSPWSRRAIAIIDDIWKNARIETPFGVIPTRNFEVNGDLLQVCPRLFAFTGDRKYLEWAIRLGDYYLLGTNHPTRDLPQLALRDHACELFNGLSELYVAVAHAAPEKQQAYAAPLHELYDRLLAIGRNEHGLFYSQVDTRTGAQQGPLTDNWGYNLDGVYTAFLVDGTPAYRDAVRTALGNLKPHYTGQIWEGGSADGYADSIEGALTLLNREPVASAADWIDSEIRTMWAKQRPDGVIEGWHGDGNFSRTSLMYALWKTQGCRIEPWRADLRVGAVRDGEALYVSVAADQPWAGRLRFDTPRHREIMKLPLDYPRINQFPEWFTVATEGAYQVVVDGVAATRPAADLRAGLEFDVKPGEERQFIITRRP